MHPIILLRYVSFTVALCAFITVVLYNKYRRKNISLVSKEFHKQSKISSNLRITMWISFYTWILTFVIKFFMDLDPDRFFIVINI